MPNWVSRILIVAGALVLVVAACLPPAAIHPVSGSMRAAAGAVAGRQVTSQSASGTDGRSHSPAVEARYRPLVLFFIKDGCPCSESAEPFFQKLQAAYGTRASFLGVIDGDLGTARDWATRHGTPYPILADPDRRVISACDAERSAYVMLATPGGAIEMLWPGYSTSMLAEAGERLARLTGIAQVAIDTRGAPAEMVSGCSF